MTNALKTGATLPLRAVCTKNLNPNLMMMKPAKDRVCIYGSDR